MRLLRQRSKTYPLVGQSVLITKSRKSVFTVLVLVNLFSYSFNSFYENTLQLYFGETRTKTEIGIIIAVCSFVTIFASLFWGIVADRAKYKNTVLALTAVCSAVLFVAFSLTSSFYLLLGIAAIFSFFLSPIPGLCDTVTLQSCDANKLKYGPIRVFASLIYGFLPFFILMFRNIKIIFPAYAVLAVCLAVTLYLTPRVEGGSHLKKDFSLKPLFSDKKLLILLVFVIVMNLTWYFHHTYYSLYLTQELGFGHNIWGWVALITIIGELPLFIFYDKLFRRGIKFMLLPAIIMIALRFIALSFLKSLPVIFAVALITGFAPTTFTYCITYYIEKHASDEIKASGITLIYSVAAVPKIFGFLFGGTLADSLGTPAVLRIAAAVWGVAFIFYILKVVPDKSGVYGPQKQTEI